MTVTYKKYRTLSSRLRKYVKKSLEGRPMSNAELDDWDRCKKLVEIFEKINGISWRGYGAKMIEVKVEGL